MKKWDNPEVVELNINSTASTYTTENYADEVFYAEDGSTVLGVKQGLSESGPQMKIEDYLQ